MVKKMVVFVLIIATLCALSLRTYAAEELTATEDSKVVSQDIVSQIDPTGSSIIFRIYSVDLRIAFNHYESIDEILASTYLRLVTYSQKSDDGYAYWRYRNNKCERVNRFSVDYIATNMFETGEVVGYIGPDVVVLNSYYLSGESTNRGSAIYYRTNKGDYVYFSHCNVGEKLFPVKAFCAYQRAIANETTQNQNQGPGLVGDGTSGVAWDLSPYDFRSDTFNLNAPIPGSEDSEQEDSEDPVIPEPPKEDVDTPVIHDPPEEDGSADIKFQTKDNSLRLVTWVDSLNYKEIVFNVTIGGQTATIPCTTVYSSINAGDLKLNSAANVFNEDALYFVTYTINNIPASVTEFQVSVTWTDLEGNTRTSGTRTIIL